ncbi:MAG TPA: hypothetical protein VK983_05535 [Candidatus Limnocylindrales bacterium]|nr:hypothetical protein [Candidatus Limnocylindrales bacterium]
MPRKRTVAVVSGLGLATAAWLGGIQENLANPDRDTSQPIASYEGRPFVPGSQLLDRVTRFGNMSLKVYADEERGNYAKVKFEVTQSLSATALMTCTSTDTLMLESDTIPGLNYSDSRGYAHQICRTGELTANTDDILSRLPQR